MVDSISPNASGPISPQRKRKNVLLVILALIVSASGLLLYGIVASEGRDFMGGSKSGAAILPSQPGISTPYPRREFFGGSKSAPVRSPEEYAPYNQIPQVTPTASKSPQH